jgi:hypothetical protein
MAKAELVVNVVDLEPMRDFVRTVELVVADMSECPERVLLREALDSLRAAIAE